jgi:hypothetical protein
LNLSVTLENEWGEPLRVYSGRGGSFVLGEAGQRYRIRISNQSPVRVEAVVSVDGRDAVSGEVADYVHHRGYLVNAFDSVVVDGFRRSLESAAEFRFTDVPNSYSARRGTPENVGVIGVALFTERRARPEPPPPPSGWWDSERDESYYEGAPRGRSPSQKRASGEAPPRSAPAPAPAPTHPDSANDIGTEYGPPRWSPVVEVPFLRASPSRPSRTILLRYDDAAGLQARGIRVFDNSCWSWRREEPGPCGRPVDDPIAFPANRFAPPPP